MTVRDLTPKQRRYLLAAWDGAVADLRRPDTMAYVRSANRWFTRLDWAFGWPALADITDPAHVAYGD